MKPIVPAEAPSSVRYAPRMLDAPSCVMSENRLTMPNSTTNAMACEYFRFCLFSIGCPLFHCGRTLGKPALLSVLQR